MHASAFSRFDCILSLALTMFAVRAYNWTQFIGDQAHNGNKTCVAPAVRHPCGWRSDCARFS